MFEGVLTVTFNEFSDLRGTFLKVFQKLDNLSEFDVQQVNMVTTEAVHTLRGLHYQGGEHAESKLFRVVSGAAQLGFVDVRPTSATFLQFGSITVDEPRTGVLVPRGFATGYLTLAARTTVLYLSDRPYVADAERGLRWDDPAIGMSWRSRTPIVSVKDVGWPDWSSREHLPD